MNKCKRCSYNDLKLVNNHPYEDVWTSEISLISAYICPNCGCMHWTEDGVETYQYAVHNREQVNNIGNWATNRSIAEEKLKLKELENVEI